MKPEALARVSVVIPAYNEEKNLPRTVAGLQAELRRAGIPYELVLVDDNSRDGTGEVITELLREDPAVVPVRRTPPGGFGRAIRDGLAAAGGDVVVICMADASDDPRDVVAYVREIENGADCVFGSRFVRGSTLHNYPRGKLIANRIVNKAIQWMFRCPYNDLTNAFKAYRAEVIAASQPLQACHFNITIEMSLAALNRRFEIAQIPIAWYGRTWGSSNLKLREMGRRYLHTLIKAYGERVLIADDVMGDELARRQANRNEPDVPSADDRAPPSA